MNLLFVVHRYGWPGGSEYYTAAMAEESLRRGHNVAVFAGEHKGDQNGIRVTNDPNILLLKWDLIIVHGCDTNNAQDFVLQNAKNIPSSILYMIILPSNSQTALNALEHCLYLGWSTSDDINYLHEHNVGHKAVRVRHSINHNESLGKPGFKNNHNITSKMFLSCGGYWQNKKMKELALLFLKADIPDTVLVTTGYDNRFNLMPNNVPDKIINLLIDDKSEVLSAISEADCYLMHSSQEGFGLVILESMLNKTPWIARHIAGPAMLKNFGKTYHTDDELILLLQNFNRDDFDLDSSHQYIIDNHLIANTINDIENVAATDIINKRQARFKV